MAKRPSRPLRAAVVKMLKATGLIGSTRELEPIAGRMLQPFLRTNTLADLLPLYRHRIAMLLPRYKAMTGQLPGTFKHELDEREQAELDANIKHRRWLERAIARLEAQLSAARPPGE